MNQTNVSRWTRWAAVPALAVLLTGVATAPANADSYGSDTDPVGPTVTYGESDADVDLASTGPVMAEFRGEMIDLSKGWGEATICAEEAPGEVNCYASAQEQAAATGAFTTTAWTDCSYYWVCIWQYSDATGKKLQWRDTRGKVDLADWGFRNKTSAVYANRAERGVEFIVVKDLWPDQHIFYPAGAGYSMAGEDWDNKIDYIVL